jgi:hypothetical protein
MKDWNAIIENQINPKQGEDVVLVWEILITGGLILCALLALYLLLIRSGLYKAIMPPYSRFLKAAVTGWVIWCLCVFSYSRLFENRVDFEAWLTLPPLCVIAITLWFSRFIRTTQE